MNRENLLKLATYLVSDDLKARFDMAAFSNRKRDEPATDCGTIGCAVGHGPYAGIPKLETENWAEYLDRAFEVNAPEYYWLFSGGWYKVDNTPQGAAKRILWLLRYGVPLDANEQLDGEAELCYLN